ncbi:MAG: hypothetical protein TEF_07125 [Rhizobiales bacterium NRL2]|jgi:hypothetical protein|nr:MAG: hypothetical protein TEF_07125 [Rhizobiales bacterium NRL2]
MADGFEWDEAKNAANLRKHGVAFEEAVEIFEGPHFSRLDDRFDYGEVRDVSIGLVGGQVLVTVAHTERGGVTRMISARKATKAERRLFFAYLEKALGGN